MNHELNLNVVKDMHSFIYRRGEKNKQKNGRICSQAVEGLSTVLVLFSF